MPMDTDIKLFLSLNYFFDLSNNAVSLIMITFLVIVKISILNAIEPRRGLLEVKSIP